MITNEIKLTQFFPLKSSCRLYFQRTSYESKLFIIKLLTSIE
jgi:hypothetical protein